MVQRNQFLFKHQHKKKKKRKDGLKEFHWLMYPFSSPIFFLTVYHLEDNLETTVNIVPFFILKYNMIINLRIFLNDIYRKQTGMFAKVIYIPWAFWTVKLSKHVLSEYKIMINGIPHPNFYFSYYLFLFFFFFNIMNTSIFFHLSPVFSSPNTLPLLIYSFLVMDENFFDPRSTN